MTFTLGIHPINCLDSKLIDGDKSQNGKHLTRKKKLAAKTGAGTLRTQVSGCLGSGRPIPHHDVVLWYSNTLCYANAPRSFRKPSSRSPTSTRPNFATFLIAVSSKTLLKMATTIDRNRGTFHHLGPSLSGGSVRRRMSEPYR